MSTTKPALLCGVVLMLLTAVGCGSRNSEEIVKFQLYYAQGELIYNARCANCHQHSGDGLGLVYPPLNTSDFMDNNFEKAVCLIRNGAKGEMIVNGKQFNQPMFGVPVLTDLEMAELTTYIYNTWSHNRGIVETENVSRILGSCRRD